MNHRYRVKELESKYNFKAQEEKGAYVHVYKGEVSQETISRIVDEKYAEGYTTVFIIPGFNDDDPSQLRNHSDTKDGNLPEMKGTD